MYKGIRDMLHILNTYNRREMRLHHTSCVTVGLDRYISTYLHREQVKGDTKSTDAIKQTHAQDTTISTELRLNAPKLPSRSKNTDRSQPLRHTDAPAMPGSIATSHLRMYLQTEVQPSKRNQPHEP